MADIAADLTNPPCLLQKLEGSKCRGQLLIFGATNWDLIGRKEVPKQQGEQNALHLHRQSSYNTTTTKHFMLCILFCSCVLFFFPTSRISKPGPEFMGATQVWVSLRCSGAECGFGTMCGS